MSDISHRVAQSALSMARWILIAGVVAMAVATEVLVYRAMTNVFNVWSTKALVNTLMDYGDRLAIMDSTGQEVPGRAH